MPVKRPSGKMIASIAEKLGLHLSQKDIDSYKKLLDGPLASYNRIEKLPAKIISPKYPRTGGRRPHKNDNPLNAWYQKCDIKGAKTGKLHGKTVVVKDNICVAGIPMMNGTSLLEGYIPDIDATVVTRVLDAGGTIVGKAVCENLCFSGGSHTTDTETVLNPNNTEYSSGGSSSGCAALVKNNDVDMAIGGDQGGSVRMPASWCGVVGLKPTYGLVPYTGSFPIELTLDHLGPITKDVSDCATLLDILAGYDGLDPRQSIIKNKSYSSGLEKPLKNFKIGVVEEGFGWPNLSENDVDDCVLKTLANLESTDLQISQIKIPMHRDGVHIWNAIAIEGANELMMKGNSMGTNWKGYYNVSLLEKFATSWRSRPNDLSETTKLVMIMGEYMSSVYNGKYYCLAQNLAHSLREAYDDLLNTYDVLVMPTMPIKATKIPAADCSREEYIARALEMINNTAPFDVTGHPSITIPCKTKSDLPIGIMITGKHFEDDKILNVARFFEKNM